MLGVVEKFIIPPTRSPISASAPSQNAKKENETIKNSYLLSHCFLPLCPFLLTCLQTQYVAVFEWMQSAALCSTAITSQAQNNAEQPVKSHRAAEHTAISQPQLDVFNIYCYKPVLACSNSVQSKCQASVWREGTSNHDRNSSSV